MIKRYVVTLALSSLWLFGYQASIQDVVVQNRTQIGYLKSQLAEQKERIDGLTSLIDSMNQTINELKQKQRVLSKNDNTKLLKELGSMIDEINSNYVRKDELQKILAKYKVSQTKVQTTTEDISKLEPKELYSQAMKLYSAKDYKGSISRFALCDKKGYKVAQSNFYLGEIAYYSKKYDNALFYYKKSAYLYKVVLVICQYLCFIVRYH